MPEGGALVDQEVPLRNAMNEVLRDEYVKDCQRAVDRWNKTITEAGLTGVSLRLPHRRFNRAVGPCASVKFDTEGRQVSDTEFANRRGDWLPNEAERTYVKSLMVGVYAPGKMAGWIAPPAKGIDGKPLDFEYVKAPSA